MVKNIVLLQIYYITLKNIVSLTGVHHQLRQHPSPQGLSPVILSVHMLNLSKGFTSQTLSGNARGFNNHVVDFVSGLYKTEGDSS